MKLYDVTIQEHAKSKELLEFKKLKHQQVGEEKTKAIEKYRFQQKNLAEIDQKLESTKETYDT